MKTIRTTLLAAALAVMALSPTIAADKHDHGDKHEHSGKHGGKIVESGHHHVEVVAKDGVLEVYVNGEDGQPEIIKDAKATAAVLSEGKKEDLTLIADPTNVLKGAGAFKATKGTIIVVTLTMPGHDPEQARIKLD